MTSTIQTCMCVGVSVCVYMYVIMSMEGPLKWRVETMLHSSLARSRQRTRPTRHAADPQDRRTQGLYPSAKSQRAHPSQRQAHRGIGIGRCLSGTEPESLLSVSRACGHMPNAPKTHPDSGSGTCPHRTKFSHESTSHMDNCTCNQRENYQGGAAKLSRGPCHNSHYWHTEKDTTPSPPATKRRSAGDPPVKFSPLAPTLYCTLVVWMHGKMFGFVVKSVSCQLSAKCGK